MYDIWVWVEGKRAEGRKADDARFIAFKKRRVSSWLEVVGSPLVLDCAWD